ncbi:MAG TPA: pilus assembly protein PilE [Clostridiales bacterium]|nr:pilus assembly protein PilE [Clostridiales bacterium]
MQHKSKKGFTLIELIVVIVILGILAAIIVPIINHIIETANQTTDNANARIIYNAAAMWFSENNATDDNLEPVEVARYLGATEFPIAKSVAFGGTFSVAVAADGKITVTTDHPATYDPAIGKLQS